jgi:putative membrane protein
MMNDWNGFGGWGMGLGFIFMLLLWGLVILGIAALIRWLMTQSSPSHSPRDKSPLEIVQERYARGEIDREEYERKMRDLES